jgi:predicted HD superfamily hydrolase involved in NAD metabolism
MTAERYPDAMNAVMTHLQRDSAEHSVRVAQAAARLAEAYGSDVEDARIAGVLHDWCRDVGGAELLRRATDAGLPVTAVDTRTPYLLHGPLAAVELRVEFPWLSSQVLDAIAVHTYGSADIDTLGMILYVADSIEPGRTHEGVQELREAVGEVPLSELFARTYAASLRHLVAARRPIHPATAETWNARVAGDRP